MSKVAPHNAVIEILNEDGKRIIAKRYRKSGKFTARQEADAYLNLEKLLLPIEGIRPATILKLDETNNVLYLEYIPGLNLFERIAEGDTICLGTFKQTLFNFFLAAKHQQLCFDSDPSNILIDSKGMVLIDPVCKEQSLDDFTFIVFMWGLIKISLRNIKAWRTIALTKLWKIYYRSYCDFSGTTIEALNSQMVSYIDQVKKWNRERNAVEGSFFYVFRRGVVIPIYSFVRLLFRHNVIR